MKIFDFTNGSKGKLLANIRRPNGYTGWFISDEEKAETIGRYSFHCDAYYGTDDFAFQMESIPEKFGVEAICYCPHSYEQLGKTIWDWNYTATREWLESNNRIITNRPVQ